jgi:hypothetical protein
VPLRLSLATKGSESQEANLGDSQASDRLATPSSGGRISFKASGLPVPVGTTDGSKFKRLAADGQTKSKH